MWFQVDPYHRKQVYGNVEYITIENVQLIN